MQTTYCLYPLKRNTLSLTRDTKTRAEDAAVQGHPSFIQLCELWYQYSVLERAVYMYRLAARFKKVAIARNLGKDEGTVRLYVAVAKLSSYWKLKIDAGENYARVLKAAKADPQPGITVADQASEGSSQEPTNQVNATNTLPIIEDGEPIATNRPQDSERQGLGRPGGPVQQTQEPGLRTTSAKSVPVPAHPSPIQGGGQTGQFFNGIFPRQSTGNRKYGDGQPKTPMQERLERQLQRVQQKLGFVLSPTGRAELQRQQVELERKLAALSGTRANRTKLPLVAP